MELPIFPQFIHNVVGDGRDTYSWEDKWLEDKPLCSHPCLYHLFSLQNHSTASILDPVDLLLSPPLGLRQPLT